MQSRDLSSILKAKVRYYFEVLNPEPKPNFSEPARTTVGKFFAAVKEKTVEAATYVANGGAGELGRERAKSYRDNVVDVLVSNEFDLRNNQLLAVVFGDLNSNKIGGRLDGGKLFRGCMVAGLYEYLTGEVIKEIDNGTALEYKSRVNDALFAKLRLSNQDREVRVRALNAGMAHAMVGAMAGANFEATMIANRLDVTKNMILEAFGNLVHLEQENRVGSSLHAL